MMDHTAEFPFFRFTIRRKSNTINNAFLKLLKLIEIIVGMTGFDSVITSLASFPFGMATIPVTQRCKR